MIKDTNVESNENEQEDNSEEYIRLVELFIKLIVFILFMMALHYFYIFMMCDLPNII